MIVTFLHMVGTVSTDIVFQLSLVLVIVYPLTIVKLANIVQREVVGLTLFYTTLVTIVSLLIPVTMEFVREYT